jgi:hypothetical protein
MELLFKLLIAHALADFSLQSDSMAKGKNRHNIVTPPCGQKYIPCWPYWLTAHALIHGGSVWLITGNVWLGLIEVIAHWTIDFIKCENKTNPHQDQAMHLLCKIAYSII